MRVILPILLATVSHAAAATINFSDSFEAPTFDAFWQVSQAFGTVALSTDQAFSGIQSAKFSSSPGGQRDMSLNHDFGEAMVGSVSVRFFDFAPGQQTLYEYLLLWTPSSADNFFLGTQDYEAQCYTASINNVQGPAQNCGSLPDVTTTNVTRTAGWHLLEIIVGQALTEWKIDGTTVYSNAGVHSFQNVRLGMSGPGGRPDTTVYWDDVDITATPLAEANVPEPTAFVLTLSGLAVIAARRYRRQVRAKLPV